MKYSPFFFLDRLIDLYFNICGLKLKYIDLGEYKMALDNSRDIKRCWLSERLLHSTKSFSALALYSSDATHKVQRLSMYKSLTVFRFQVKVLVVFKSKS